MSSPATVMLEHLSPKRTHESRTHRQPMFAVAPMMAWTDRHCRYLMRLCSPDALLFTEMITSGALIHGPRERLLKHSPQEHPVAIQLGGCDPAEMGLAAGMAAAAGYAEINLNVGCPSPRVQRGRFGACLMTEPDLVAEIVMSMRESVTVPVTVKCRLGVDDADSQPRLESFVSTVADAGCSTFYVHARKALLNGISPAQNRQIPPLQIERVYALKRCFSDLTIFVNGGIRDAATALEHLQHVDAVMIGREAYHNPLLLSQLGHQLHGTIQVDGWQVLENYLPYMQRELKAGTRLHDMTRHCLGLFNHVPGARRFRQILSDGKRLRANDLNLVHEALGAVHRRVA